MKKLLSIIILLNILTSQGQIFTNGVYVSNGKTFEVDKKEHRFTLGTVYFSNDLIVKVSTNSDFTINSFFQEVFDIDKTAHKARFGNNSFSATLMKGSIVVVYSGTNENDSCAISTPLTDVELFKGTFFFSVTDTSVVVFVLDGSLKAHGDKKKEVIVKAGSAISAVGNDRGIFEDKVSLEPKVIRMDALKKLSEEALTVVQLKGTFLFIIIDGKIVGVNVKTL